MNTDELAAIPIWVQQEVAKRRIPELFSELASVVQNNANGSAQAFESQKSALINAVGEVDFTALTDAQVDFLTDQLKLIPHLGRQGVEEIEGILFRNSLDVSTAAGEMNRISGEIQTAIDRSNQIKAALSGLVSPKDVPSDEILLRVTFDHKAAISDIVDFKKWAAEWHDIGRGISMAVGETPKHIRVVGAQTGSIILTLATTYAIAEVVSKVLLKVLEVAEKVQGLRKARLEIEALKLSNKQALDAIQAQEQSEREDGQAEIAASISAEMNLDGEKIEALTRAVNKLLSFVEKGGEVDLLLPAEMHDERDDPNSNGRKLAENVTKIRELERFQRLLSQHSEEDN